MDGFQTGALVRPAAIKHEPGHVYSVHNKKKTLLPKTTTFQRVVLLLLKCLL